MKPIHRIIIIAYFLLILPTKSLSMNVIAQFAWQKIVPASFALLANHLTKIDTKELDVEIQEKLKTLKEKTTKPDPYILSPHVAQKFFLSPIYIKALDLTGHKFQFQIATPPPCQQIINLNGLNEHAFTNSLWRAYDLLCQGDFKNARDILSSFMGRNETYTATITQLLKSFNAFGYNKYNILTRYERDDLWSSLTEAKKIEVSTNKALRDAMNLELSLRHEILTKLQEELGLTNLKYKGLNTFLFSLMNLSPEQKFRLLLSLKPDDELRPAFYEKDGILKIFSKTSYTHSDSKSDQYLRRMNALLFYNQDCKNGELFSRASKAITAGINGNSYFTHLAYESISPTHIHDFIANIDQINSYIQQKNNTSDLPQSINNNKNNDSDNNHNDPDNYTHSKFMALLAALQDKTEELEELINTRLYDLAEKFYIRSINIFHTFHGDCVKGFKPTGCHSNWGRCCFEIRKTRFWDINRHGICDITKYTKTKPSSSMFPDWPMEKILDKLIEWVKNGNIRVIHNRDLPSLKLIQLTKNCCSEVIEFRVIVKNDIGDIESFYPLIRSLINNYIQSLNCSCME